MPTIDLAFELVGATIPLDHGYALFAALNRLAPALHGDRRIGIHPIRGRQVGRGTLGLIGGSRLRLRLPSEEIAPMIRLGGTKRASPSTTAVTPPPTSAPPSITHSTRRAQMPRGARLRGMKS